METILVALIAAAASVAGSVIAARTEFSKRMAERDQRLDEISKDLKEIKTVQNAQSHGLLSTMLHITTGNHVEQLKKDIVALQDALIER